MLKAMRYHLEEDVRVFDVIARVECPHPPLEILAAGAPFLSSSAFT
jgi:hypothetical protein